MAHAHLHDLYLDEFWIYRKRYAIIRSLIDAGENLNEAGCSQKGNDVINMTDGTGYDVTEVRCDKTGNSVLHIAVNGSSDCADQSLQLESTLVKKGCDLFTINNLKR